VDSIPADGTGQTIAIVDAYGSPTMQQDLDTLCFYIGLPETTVSVYYPQGQPGFDLDWAAETALDLEWAHVIAPQARLVLVVAKTQAVQDLLGAVDYAANVVAANVVSMSWGFDEFPEEVLLDPHFQKRGVAFVTSSGDSGENVQWPAVSPHVLSVGGTSLYVDGNGNYTSETSWSGSGGGISVYEPQPYYQSGWLAATGRGVPDVSYVADPNTGVAVIFEGYLFIFGGTSVGAPQWAGLIALANSLSRSRGLDSANAAVYAVASLNNGFDIDPTYFYDITSGNNGDDPDDFATSGYDLVTGLGSPVGQNVVLALTTLMPPPPKRLPVGKAGQQGYQGSPDLSQ
jgi:subtilase family serine protease